MAVWRLRRRVALNCAARRVTVTVARGAASLVEDYMVMRQYEYCRIDGNTSYDDRQDFIDAYNKEGQWTRALLFVPVCTCLPVQWVQWEGALLLAVGSTP